MTTPPYARSDAASPTFALIASSCSMPSLAPLNTEEMNAIRGSSSFHSRNPLHPPCSLFANRRPRKP
ncbi:hypothetical protein M5K25_004619 [Dendrobium thyrsiflorum]|uniref:Uncharacterized protein n=1 Tax=Dendrobium thyrsiflorum TaxID=117978 RepID=A0ABD0VGJ2_DENTH